ncbi:signal recognition particle-docking protein FtsY [Oscillospiraceae bacterium OttesenSCG-928-G22]|nr:signal recognition particle-docking protein FtsY [Oscillospiraceae bacterium OttesenSCG-928-G22]
MAFFDKIREGLKKTRNAIGGSFDAIFTGFTKPTEEFYEELEETLILADVGVRTATETVAALRERVKTERLGDSEKVQAALSGILASYLMGEKTVLNLSTRPSVILLIGVNGVGKTTTAGKLAERFRAEGKKVLLAAADTFRAAAADQLQVWAERTGADFVRQAEGSDPAAVVFDALKAAKARGADVVICDTAGRLHNKQNLMNELSKISRIIDKELPDAARETLLVLDATTGGNGLEQARQFKEAADVSGIVLTKLDGTAKGGIVIAIGAALEIPVKFIGVGEKAEDLLPFEAEDFVKALLEPART